MDGNEVKLEKLDICFVLKLCLLKSTETLLWFVLCTKLHVSDISLLVWQGAFCV